MKDLFFKTIMLKGEAGGTIASIEKTGSALNVDTYTITLNDGETSTFEVTNGTSIASISKTGTSGLVDTYTITLTDGSTTTFEVTNGEDAYYYELPSGAVVYFDSEDPTPQGYEATGNPNAARLNTLQSEIENLDNNLLLGGYFSVQGEGTEWTFTKDSASGNALGFHAPTGFMLPAGVSGTLYSPRMTDMAHWIADYFDYDSMVFSVSVFFKSYSHPSDVPLTLAKIENVNNANRNERIYTLPNILELKVRRIAEGGNFGIHVNNLSSSYGIGILAIKLEIGETATPYRFLSPLNGVRLGDKLDKLNITPRDNHGFTNYSDMKDFLSDVFDEMDDGETRLEKISIDFAEAIFGGEPNVFLIYKHNSNFMAVTSLTNFVKGTRYQGTWTWTKATMTSVTV